MKKPVLIAVLLLLGAAAAAWLLLGGGAGASDALAASGSVEATEADLGFQVPGRIEEIVPREGDAVSGGQELAFLDTRELRAALGMAEAQERAARARLEELERGARPEELRQAESALASARAREADARRDAERAKALVEGGAAPSRPWPWPRRPPARPPTSSSWSDRAPAPRPWPRSAPRWNRPPPR